MAVSYFDAALLRRVEATVRELRQTRLLVENRQDQKLWPIPSGAMNLGGVGTDIRAVPITPPRLEPPPADAEAMLPDVQATGQRLATVASTTDLRNRFGRQAKLDHLHCRRIGR
jgi:hypothetical protein